MKKKTVRLLISCLTCMLILNIFMTPASMAIYKENETKTPDSQKYSPDSVIVKFNASMPEKDKEYLKNNLGIETVKKYSLTGSELVKIKNKSKVTDVVEKLKKNPGVVYAEPDYIYQADATVNDPSFGSLWGLNNTNDIDIDAPEAWDITQGSSEIVVAVIDEGIDKNHPDIAANIWTNPGETPGDGIDNDGNGYIDDVDGWDFYHGDNSIFDAGDGDDHGTHVAGTIAAIANNGVGVAGVAPKVKIMPIKFIGPGGGYTSDAISAIEYANMMGAKLSSNSWGGAGNSAALRDAINNFNGVFVAAAGNNGANTDINPHYPSSYDCSNIISVAALDSSGNLAYYSNYGTTTVDVGAPGSYILSLAPNSSYQYMSGTSMATPHVSGIAALILSINPSLNPVQVRDIIKQTSMPLASLQGKTASGGMANAYQAVSAIKKGPYVKATDPTNNMDEVPLNKTIALTFNENIQPGDNFSGITLKSSGEAIPVSADTDGSTLNIVPSLLHNDSKYTLEIPSNAVKNQAGEGLWMPYFLNFSTPDTLGPVVISVNPADGSSNVSVNGYISIKFNENIMQGSSFNSITVNGTPVGGTPTDNNPQWRGWVSGDTLDIYPPRSFSYITQYTVVIPDGAVSDVKGNPFKGTYTLNFKTETDTYPPFVLSTYPYSGTTNVSLNSPIIVEFNEIVKEGTNFGGITLSAGSSTLQVSKTLNGQDMTLQPLSKLVPNTTYTVTIPVNCVVDSFGNTLVEPYSSSFTTGLYDVAELPFYVDDAVMDPEKPVIYMLDAARSSLYAYNYTTGVTSQVNLTYAPISIDIGKGQYSNEIYAALTSRVPGQYTGQSTQPLSIAVIDRSTLAVKDTISIGIEPCDIIAGRDGYIYVTPEDGQWSHFLSFDRATKMQKGTTDIRQMTYGKLHPTIDRIYTIDTDLSPRDYTAYNISAGLFTDPHYPGGYDSPYHGEYNLNPEFDIDPTGRYLFNGSGHIFTTSPDKAQDMRYAAKLDAGFSDIAFDNDLSSFYTLSYSGNVVSIYRGKDFTLDKSLGIARTGRYLFKQGNKLVVILAPSGGSKYYTSGLQVLDIPDDPPAVLSTDPADKAVNVPVDTNISVSFSENVVAGSAFESISLTDDSGNSVPLTKSIDGSFINMKPGILNYSTNYVLSIPANAIKDSGGNTLIGDYSMSFTTMPKPDTTAPTILTTDPVDGAAKVPVNQDIMVTFSENVAAGDTYGSITLKDGNDTLVNITKSINGSALTIDTGTLNLNYSTNYTLTIPVGAVKDGAGNPLANPVSISFSTEPKPDTVPPAINAYDPTNGTINIPLTKVISITFSEDVASGSAYDNIALKDSSSNAVPVTKNITGSVMTITPSKLNYSTIYTLAIPAYAVVDLTGNALANAAQISFTTQPQPDTTAPVVTSADPMNGSSNVPVGKSITIVFSENVLEGTQYGSISLKDSSNTAAPLTKSINGSSLTITLVNKLNYNTKYTLNIPSGAVQDGAKNGSVEYILSFTTEQRPDTTAPTIVSTNPLNGATDVLINTKIIITFSEDIQLGTDSSKITVKKGTKAVSIKSLSIANKNQLVIDIGTLSTRSSYTVYIPQGTVKDMVGNYLSASYTFSYTTGRR